MYNSLVIKGDDTVLTVIAPIKAGESIIYNFDGEEKSLTASVYSISAMYFSAC